MPRLLVVHHTASPATHSLYERVLKGANDPSIEGVEIISKAALEATAIDVLHCDGYVLGTPANIGYMSGALKHFFDQIYYPCLDSTKGRPYGVYIHGNNDTGGALRAIETIATGLGWRVAQRPVEIIGTPSPKDLQACFDLGAAMAALTAELAE